MHEILILVLSTISAEFLKKRRLIISFCFGFMILPACIIFQCYWQRGAACKISILASMFLVPANFVFSILLNSFLAFWLLFWFHWKKIRPKKLK